MKKLNKTVFWSSIVFLGLWLIVSLVRTLLNLKFANDSMKSDCQSFILFAIPIAILLTLFGTLKSNEKKVLKFFKIAITSMISGYSMFILYISISFNMCVWTDIKILYENKRDPTKKIISQHLECGATDSKPASPKVYKLQNFSKLFVRTTEIDTSKIDNCEWIKIE